MFLLQNPYIAVELDAGGSSTMPTDMRFKPNASTGYVWRLSSNRVPEQILLGLYVFDMGLMLLFSIQRAHCAICTDRIWGLGRQGYKCINCKLLVHKKCHKLVTVECGRQVIQVRRQCMHKFPNSCKINAQFSYKNINAYFLEFKKDQSSSVQWHWVVFSQC